MNPDHPPIPNDLRYPSEEEEWDDEWDAPSSVDLYEHYRVEADLGQSPIRVDKFLTDRLPKVSRNRIQLAAEAGFLFANDKAVKSNYRVKPKDVITIKMETPPSDFVLVPENIPLKIAYEDDDLLVVNKPAGMVVHPGHGNYSGTLVHALAYYLRNDPLYDPNDPAVGLVHRIDKDTSGLILVAKRPHIKAHLAQQFFHKTTGRVYYALVWGKMAEQEGRIEGNIARDNKDRTKMCVLPSSSPLGKWAVTHYQVVERLGYVTLVQCRLETGRTHQIRAHMTHIGHPLFADEKYGGDQILWGNRTSAYTQFIKKCMQVCPRQALHASTLSFYHPTRHKRIDLEAPIPQDITTLVDLWREWIACE